MLENQSLKSLNSLALEARARYFLAVSDIDELRQALVFARQRTLPVLLLGGGSNLVLTEDFPGLCIQLLLRGIETQPLANKRVRVSAGAGENWHQFVSHCLRQGWHGLENLALIPGTVGAAPVQNIGAYGVEINAFFHSLQALDRETLELRTFCLDECEFGYRDSIFKGTAMDRYVITRVSFDLSRIPALKLTYGALGDELDDCADPKPQDLFDAVVRVRSSKLPDPDRLPNAGSFFKNPVITTERFAALKEQYPDIVAYPEHHRVKLAAGWMIDRAGWKGYRRGDAGVHDRQALVLVNHGAASGKEILSLASDIRADILQRFGVELEIEPRCY